ncbi:PREDICTED: spermatogenesis-associated protein 3 isoform X2 [Chinchilla lanigera]|uniref:spermatogenesis-associated protein 3 isoform X2 n=1 Tax=Chinchilla lanigera TaxID=34839 RepID=UPI000697FC2C|nr:PREDICTED: spermatogenesis-associated protein 3 isoform X2 [Chinchilla lanigera]
MEQPIGAQPSEGPQEESAEEQEDMPAPSAEGRGQVLLIGGYWKQDECCATLQDFGGSSSRRATIRPSSSTDCARRGLKRSGDSVAHGSDGPAAKSPRLEEKPQRAKPKPQAQPADAREHQTAGAPPETPGSAERGANLVLVLCSARALCTQLLRVQLLLGKVRARQRRPPTALLGVVVQPRPEEEAEARRRLESLLCSVFAPHGRAAEVHTAVFRPGRAQGSLDVQRAASQAPGVHLVDRQTQTDENLPRNTASLVLQALGTVAVALGALGAAYYITDAW